MIRRNKLNRRNFSSSKYPEAKLYLESSVLDMDLSYLDYDEDDMKYLESALIILQANDTNPNDYVVMTRDDVVEWIHSGEIEEYPSLDGMEYDPDEDPYMNSNNREYLQKFEDLISDQLDSIFDKSGKPYSTINKPTGSVASSSWEYYKEPFEYVVERNGLGPMQIFINRDSLKKFLKS